LGSFIHRLDRVVPPPQVVVHNILRQRRLPSVGHFLARPPHVKLHHVPVLGELDPVVIRPLVKLKNLRRPGVRLAVEKRRHHPLPLLILHVQPRLSAQRLHHQVQHRPRLLRVLHAGLVRRLRLRRMRPRQHHHRQPHRQNSAHQILLPLM
jgi:hypothetical protein